MVPRLGDALCRDLLLELLPELWHQGVWDDKADNGLGVGFSKEPKDCAPEALQKPVGLEAPNHFALLKILL